MKPWNEVDMQSQSLVEKIILEEVSGKNKAIHAYDGIIWKVRSGYLTVLFAGWAILLKSIIESKIHSPQEFRSFVAAMFCFSAGLAVGGWFVDRTYIRRKHKGHSCFRPSE